MVQVQERCLARTVDVAHPRLRRHVFEGAVAAIAEQAPSRRPDGKQVEPPVVVIVREGCVYRAVGKGNARRVDHVTYESTAHPV